MKGMLLGAVAAAVGVLVAAAAVLHFGWIDFAADVPHSRPVAALIEFARERSVARGSRAVAPPADLADAGRIRRGAGNYDAMCVNCHLAPGVADTEIRRGLYPQPPDLAKAPDAGASIERAAARSFWIIKHGIKASGMPAWGRGGMDDADVWDLVAFLGALPTLSAQRYREQVAASEGHVHGGAKAESHENAKSRAHDHKGHAH